MDGAVDASSGHERTVGGVDDGVDLDGRDVGAQRPDHRWHHWSPQSFVADI
jgi:hypothetical protein